MVDLAYKKTKELRKLLWNTQNTKEQG
jgi:hypothetical protein